MSFSESIDHILIWSQKDYVTKVTTTFKPLGYRISEVKTQQHAFELLKAATTYIVIVDTRVAENHEIDFLIAVRKASPQSIRVLVASDADIDYLHQAINEAGIHKVLTPMSSEDHIQAIIQSSVIECMSERTYFDREEYENRSVVNERAAEIRKTCLSIAKHYDEAGLTTKKIKEILKKSCPKDKSLDLFINNEKLKRIALAAATLAARLKSSTAEIKSVYIAALLMDIGKVSLLDNLLDCAYEQLSDQEKKSYLKHVDYAVALLEPMYELSAVKDLLQSSQEFIDGSGYPEGLKK
ncbi:HD domain-containing phosphohydrolase [Piscirickettsia litoralis]|uniref:HD-GYP domain-containing protein n=1 Tax=Piscirickettsia litoralis TaxID=1891921 RepID=A0ABX3A3B3_9GAMM|nr:HD domain-containing phosphohydrolase [Piscirickettsia litoralis]ODN42126.1 hypothetical protein BGC07_03155 [Piscirickettsia litoralis]